MWVWLVIKILLYNVITIRLVNSSDKIMIYHSYDFECLLTVLFQVSLCGKAVIQVKLNVTYKVMHVNHLETMSPRICNIALCRMIHKLSDAGLDLRGWCVSLSGQLNETCGPEKAEYLDQLIKWVDQHKVILLMLDIFSVFAQWEHTNEHEA